MSVLPHTIVASRRLAVAVVAVIVILTATQAFARLSGEAELGYVNYQRTVSEPTPTSLAASSFTQRYSLLYDTGANFAEKSGYYKYSLGYEWSAFATKVKSPQEDDAFSVTAGRFLYSGKLLYDPKTVPVRLSAYSFDSRRNEFDRDAIPQLTNYDSILRPEIATGLRGGDSIYSGVNLVLGGKVAGSSSMFDFFLDLPKITVDYQDLRQHDLKALDPQDDRLQKFALVLNAKENWFHYRQIKYDNLIDPTQSYAEDQFIIGTVDSMLNRQWVDLTNWIKISADGQYLKHDDGAPDGSRDTTTYAVNLFTEATRRSWELRSYNNMTRTLTGESLRHESHNPMFLSGTWSAETDWQTRVNYDLVKESLADTAVRFQRDLLATVRVNSFKHSAFTLSPYFGVEQYTVDNAGVYVLNGGVESLSTPRFSSRYSLAGGYDAKVFYYSGDSISNFSLQTLSGTVSIKPVDNVRVQLLQKLVYGSGKRNPSLASSISSTQDFASAQSIDGRLTEVNEGFYRSSTDLRVNWRVQARLNMDLAVGEDFLETVSGAKESQATALHKINYSGENKGASSEVFYRRVSRSLGVGSSEYGFRGRAEYRPNRTMIGSLRYSYINDDSDDGLSSVNEELRQDLRYEYFPRNGLDRKLFDISETLVRSVQKSNTLRTESTAFLSTRYYPFRNLYVSMAARYSLFSLPTARKEFAGSAGVGVTYSKLQASLDYSFGRRDDRTDSRIEKRLYANVRKQF